LPFVCAFPGNFPASSFLPISMPSSRFPIVPLVIVAMLPVVIAPFPVSMIAVLVILSKPLRGDEKSATHEKCGQTISHLFHFKGSQIPTIRHSLRLGRCKAECHGTYRGRSA
jgi:hypothetical protein